MSGHLSRGMVLLVWEEAYGEPKISRRADLEGGYLCLSSPGYTDKLLHLRLSHRHLLNKYWVSPALIQVPLLCHRNGRIPCHRSRMGCQSS